MAVAKQKPMDFTPDPQQKIALEHVSGPMLVIAGAGTGKTTVLTQRIARLIEGGHARADEILALTYTVNSAEEMKKRVLQVSSGAKDVQSFNFHDYCFKLLNRHDRGFSVLDDTDLNILLRKRIRDLNLKYYVRAAKVGQFLNDLLSFMRRCQDELVTPAVYRGYVQRLERGEVKIHRVVKSRDSEELSDEEALGRCQEIASVFETVEGWLTAGNLGTFGHMITRALDLLETQPEVLAAERAQARFILCDEFQDVNFALIRVLTLLAGSDANLFAVGDPDQAIYRFRGASSGAFDIFLRQFPATKIVRLERNRRSLSPILHCAHAIIAENPPIFRSDGRSGGVPGVPNARHVLVSVREEEATTPVQAEPVEIIAAKKELEAYDIATSIQARKKALSGHWKDFAVLYRTHSNRDEVMEELSLADIPFAVETMDVLDTPQVRDLLACVGAVVDPADSISLFRVAALPEFGVQPLDLQAVMRSAARDTDLHHLLADVAGGPTVLAKLNQVRAEIHARSSKGAAAVRAVLQRFGLGGDNLAIQAFLKFVGDWERKKPPIRETGELGELLEYLQLFREAEGKVPASPPEQRDAVQIMSAHTAKGLEFRHVSVIRVTSGSFAAQYKPSLVEFPQELRDPQSVAPGESKELHDEEERRLFYVAMTRAQDTLTLYGPPGRGKKDPTPPGYLRELLTGKSVTRWRRARDPQPLQIDLLGAEDLGFAAVSPSPVSAWIGLELPPPPQRGLSASAIESYERCPLQFKLNRDWRIPEESHAALQYGGAMHLALRHYFDAVRFERPATAEETIKIFRDEFAKAVLTDDYQRELYEQQGERQLRDFITSAERGLPSVLHTEQEFTIELAGSKVRGRIDRIDRLDDGSVRIVDYKTGKAKSQDDADDSLQLSIYALAAQQTWGYQASALALQNLEDGSMPTTQRDALQLQTVSIRVEKVGAQIAAGKFDPKTGRHCSWCGFRSLCPATEKNLAVLRSSSSKN